MMTDPEKDYLLGRIRDLERANRRWKVTALAAVAALVSVLLATGVTTVFWHFRTAGAHQEAMRERDAAEAARQEALRQRALAEERLQQAKGEQP